MAEAVDYIVEEEPEVVDTGLEEEYVPEGWKDRQSFLDHVTKLFDADLKFDQDNRKWALEDLEFMAGDQWDPEVKAEREGSMRPCMTVNVLPQFVGQVVGDRRINKTSIKVRPLKDGSAEVADVRSGLIKSIELHSRAERAYDNASEAQVACGISNLRVDMEYAGNDVFDQDILIRHIPNPLAVVWDRMSVDPTGRDAHHCFVVDRIPKDVYDKRFPDYPCPTGFTDKSNSDWHDGDSYRLCEFWELVDKPATFAMMRDGDVKDVTGMDYEEYQDQLWRHPVTGEEKIRQSFRTYARMHLVTSFAILTEAYELPLTRLPVVRVEGRVVTVGDDRVRFGLIRFAKDAQRLKNYWCPVAAELMALAPKATWHGPASAFEGREEKWTRSHLSGNGPLIWNDKAIAPPARVDPPPVPVALLQESQLNQQDIKDVTGLHDASLGMRSNEVSGKAIQARQREGDVATITFHDNLNHAIQEVGDIVNQLIPIAYDATRTIRVVGDDDKHKLMVVNDPTDENSPDITKGKYDVILETGPSFSTQRQEALDAMMTLFQTSPDLMGLFLDLVAKNMDWPGAYEIAERARKLPTIRQFLEDEESGEGGEGGGEQPSPEEAMQMQQMQQMQQAQEAQTQQLQLALAEQEAKTRQAVANADAAEAKARQAEADAEAAEAKAEQARYEASRAPELMDQKIRLAERSISARGELRNRGAGPRSGGDRPKRGNPRKEK